MPIYENLLPPYSLAPGDSATVIVSTDGVETGLPFKSERVAFSRGHGANVQHLSAELQFGGAPGAYTWQIETADTDIDANYTSEEASPVSAIPRIELPNIVANFARIKIVTLTNNVGVTGKLTW